MVASVTKIIKREMELLLDEVEKNISKHGIHKDEPMALGLSGGVDSMFLLHSLHMLGYNNIVPLIIDHKLRKKSTQEAKDVSRISKSIFNKTEILTWEHDKILSNMEEQAREARYNLLLGHCKRESIKYLLLGHHLDDQIETFLLNITRGSGLDGLCAMPDIKIKENISIIRPILLISKEEVTETMEKWNQKWFEDETNANENITRNRLRKALSKIIDKKLLNKRISNTVQRLQSIKDYIDNDTNKKYEEITETKDNITIQKQCYLKLHKELQLNILSKALLKIHQQNNKGRLTKLTKLISLINTDKKGDHKLNNCQIKWDEENIVISKNI